MSQEKLRTFIRKTIKELLDEYKLDETSLLVENNVFYS